MHATVRIYSGANELADALVERQDEVKQIISEIDGFKAYYLVRTSDGATSISVYDTEAGAEQSNRVAARLGRREPAEPDHRGASDLGGRGRDQLLEARQSNACLAASRFGAWISQASIRRSRTSSSSMCSSQIRR